MKGPVVYLAESDAEADGASAPFALLHTGTFQHAKFGRFEITEADLDTAVANFNAEKAKGHEPPIDWDHSFSEGREAPAAGWVKSLFRQGTKLMARVKWTPAAAKQIADETYRYVSAEFSSRWKDQSGTVRGFHVLAGGLTNRPALHTLGAVALSEGGAANSAAILLLAEELGEWRNRDDVAPEQLAMHERAVGLMRERGVDFAEAAAIAFAEASEQPPTDQHPDQALHERVEAIVKERNLPYEQAAQIAFEEAGG